jgi:hypothetical protein
VAHFLRVSTHKLLTEKFTTLIFAVFGRLPTVPDRKRGENRFEIAISTCSHGVRAALLVRVVRAGDKQ